MGSGVPRARPPSISGTLRHFGPIRICTEGAGLLEAALALEPDVVDELTGRNWNILGTLHWSLGNLTEAQRAYERSLAIYFALGDELSRAGLLNNLALIQVGRKDHERATLLMNDALAIYRALEEWSKVALVSINLALERVNAGEPRQALVLLEQIEQNQVEDVNLLARAHKMAALAYVRLDLMQEARAELVTALQLWRSSPDVTILPSLFVFLAAATEGVLEPSERASYLGAGEASAKTSFAQFSPLEQEVWDQVFKELVQVLGNRELDRHRKRGGRLETAALVERALNEMPKSI